MSDENTFNHIANGVDVEVQHLDFIRKQILAETSATVDRVVDEVTSNVASDAARLKAEEDKRADKRNHNRIMLMGVALCMTLLVPTVLPLWGLTGLLKYATSMALVPDLGLTAWAWIRKY